MPNPPDRPWVGIVANDRSGRGDGRARVEALVEALAARGLDSSIAWTPAERADLVARAGPVSACRCLVAVGGDGTVGALINERPAVPITTLPAGTENLFAQHYRLGRHPEALANTIAAGRTRHLDLGEALGRRYVLMAGIGFDADVVTRHHLARLGHHGRPGTTSRMAYVQPVISASLGYHFAPLTIRVEDPPVPTALVGSMAFVFNLPRYALGLKVAPAAREDDGWLDLLVFREPGPLQALRYLWLVARGLHLKRKGVLHRRVRRLSMACPEPVPIQIDGDPAGAIEPLAGPLTVGILPGALRVIVP